MIVSLISGFLFTVWLLNSASEWSTIGGVVNFVLFAFATVVFLNLAGQTHIDNINFKCEKACMSEGYIKGFTDEYSTFDICKCYSYDGITRNFVLKNGKLLTHPGVENE